MTAAAEAETRWRDHPLDAIALIRASINYDNEGEEAITRFADTNRHGHPLFAGRRSTALIHH